MGISKLNHEGTRLYIFALHAFCWGVKWKAGVSLTLQLPGRSIAMISFLGFTFDRLGLAPMVVGFFTQLPQLGAVFGLSLAVEFNGSGVANGFRGSDGCGGRLIFFSCDQGFGFVYFRFGFSRMVLQGLG